MKPISFAMIPSEPDHPAIRREKIVVRDVDEPDLGIRSIDLEASNLTSRGLGDLTSEAHREIEYRLDLLEYVGEHVATVWYDAEAWLYRIEWQVEVPLIQRIQRLLSFGGESGD